MKQKAKRLVDRFYDVNDEKQSTLGTNPYISMEYAKQCALICVDEMWELSYDAEFEIPYFKELKQEIEKL